MCSVIRRSSFGFGSMRQRMGSTTCTWTLMRRYGSESSRRHLWIPLLLQVHATCVYIILCFEYCLCIIVQPSPSNTLTQQTGLATSSPPGSDYGNGTQAPYSIIVSVHLLNLSVSQRCDSFYASVYTIMVQNERIKCLMADSVLTVELG